MTIRQCDLYSKKIYKSKSLVKSKTYKRLVMYFGQQRGLHFMNIDVTRGCKCH